MSGSPSTGKTEIAKDLSDQLKSNGTKILRLDPDKLRCRFPEYNGLTPIYFNMGFHY